MAKFSELQSRDKCVLLTEIDYKSNETVLWILKLKTNEMQIYSRNHDIQ